MADSLFSDELPVGQAWNFFIRIPGNQFPTVVPMLKPLLEKDFRGIYA
jgi:hypothetical protein